MRFPVAGSKTATAAAVALTAAALLAAAPASAASRATLSVVANTVSSQKGCIETNVFNRGDTVVFRAEAFLHGKPDLNAKLYVHLAHGPTLPMSYGAHGSGPNAPHFWSAPWTIPMNEPTGIVSYTITAVDPVHHASGVFQQMPVPPSMLTVVPYQYSVSVAVTNDGAPASVVPAGTTLTVSAKVDQVIPQRGGAPEIVPMTEGSVVAEVALEGNVNAEGQLIPAGQVSLAYDAATKAWTGTLSTEGLAPGIYIVQVNAQDTVATPNVGQATSLAFDVQ